MTAEYDVALGVALQPDGMIMPARGSNGAAGHVALVRYWVKGPSFRQPALYRERPVELVDELTAPRARHEQLRAELARLSMRMRAVTDEWLTTAEAARRLSITVQLPWALGRSKVDHTPENPCAYGGNPPSDTILSTPESPRR